MPEPWRDVNDLGFSSSPKKEGTPQKFITGVDEKEENPTESTTPEVKLIKADEWVAGENGFHFNESCYLKGTLEYLNTASKTVRRKIEADVYVETEDGEIEDISFTATGFAEDDGSFKLEVTLYYGNHYYSLVSENHEATCWYFLKNIRHSAGVNTIDSEKIQMPVDHANFDMEFSC